MRTPTFCVVVVVFSLFGHACIAAPARLDHLLASLSHLASNLEGSDASQPPSNVNDWPFQPSTPAPGNSLLPFAQAVQKIAQSSSTSLAATSGTVPTSVTQPQSQQTTTLPATSTSPIVARTTLTIPPTHTWTLTTASINPTSDIVHSPSAINTPHEGQNTSDGAAGHDTHVHLILAVVIGSIGGIIASVLICKALVASKICSRGMRNGRWFNSSKEKDAECESFAPQERFDDREKLATEYDDQGINEESFSSGDVAGLSHDSTIPPLDPQNMPIVWSRSSIFPYKFSAPLLSTNTVFRQIAEEEGCSFGDRRIRISGASFTHHARTKSAPNSTRSRYFSGKSHRSFKSAAESEWDIAYAYGAPRFDKTLSAGAASHFSVNTENWDDLVGRAA